MLSPGRGLYIGMARRYSGTILGSSIATGSCPVKPAETERVRPTPAANRAAKVVTNIRPITTLINFPENRIRSLPREQ